MSPPLMLLCFMSVYVSVCIRVCVCSACGLSERVSWVGVTVTTRLFWIWRGAQNVSTACDSSASVLCTLTHTSPTFNHLLMSQIRPWFFDFYFVFFNHSCMPEGLPPLHFVKPILKSCLCICVPHTPCWIGWYAVMNELHLTCCSSAVLPFVVMIAYDCLCHPNWMIPHDSALTSPILITVAWQLSRSIFGFYFNITAWGHTRMMSATFDYKLVIWGAFEDGFAALLTLTIYFLGWNKAIRLISLKLGEMLS